ncbi:hypothetical protein GGE65_002782 [Skermanella aerolata]|uniref:hypothetical protein n=1 Tax=Skermanella aerolata TaxID=393310 RepID=UPI003D20544E
MNEQAQPSIGPHEGRELDLMLTEKKPLALFYAIESETWILPEEEFDCHVALGKIVKADFLFKPTSPAAPAVKCVLYALPSETARVPEAAEILRTVFEELTAPTNDQERALGRLLGYTEDDIALFLSRGSNLPIPELPTANESLASSST